MSTSGIGGKLAAKAIPLQWRFAGGPEEKRAVCLETTPESPEAMSAIATPTFLALAHFPTMDLSPEDV